ncbi:hypothetical protein H0H93_007063 [Arthromyces matolae]|nr:hypothetical protein H0H93_007063 [Arthromyces matolae]
MAVLRVFKTFKFQTKTHPSWQFWSKPVHSHLNPLNSVRLYGTAPRRDFWSRPLAEVYKPGEQLTIAAPSPSRDLTIQVQIVKAFLPFTSAVVLLVEPQSTQQLPSRLILKLADRRVAEYWDSDTEHDYQANIRAHFAKDGAENPLDLVEPHLRPTWINHLEDWESVVESHKKEFEAYRRLVEAQHLGLIPRFFGPTCMDIIDGGGHPSLSRLDGLLIEYIEGRRMSSLRPGISITVEEAEIVSQHVLELGRRLRRYGVGHCDVHAGNIILRHPDNLPVLIDWGCASFYIADLPFGERWIHPLMRDNYHTYIRRLLRDGVYQEAPEKEPVFPEITAGGVWHRYRTPLSDQEHYRRANLEYPWDLLNQGIECLSAEEKEKLYHEDVDVDPRQGLRWRVKEGIKTRLIDDPPPGQ